MILNKKLHTKFEISEVTKSPYSSLVKPVFSVACIIGVTEFIKKKER